MKPLVCGIFVLALAASNAALEMRSIPSAPNWSRLVKMDFSVPVTRGAHSMVIVR